MRSGCGIWPRILRGGYAALDGFTDAVFVWLDAQGRCRYSSFVGGSGEESPTQLVVTSDGAYLIGRTSSPDLPVAGGANTSFDGDGEIFIHRIVANWRVSAVAPRSSRR